MHYTHTKIINQNCTHTVVEIGFMQDHYSVSEQPLFNDTNVCVEINNGTLEREVVITFNTIDITTEGKDHYLVS